MKRAYRGMICGQSVDFYVQGVKLNKKQVRAIRLVNKQDEAGNFWDAVVTTGKQRGKSIVIPTSEIIVFKDRDGSV